MHELSHIPVRLADSTPFAGRGESRFQRAARTAQTDAELQDWKRRNAESMKILEKTTPEMPLR